MQYYRQLRWHILFHTVSFFVHGCSTDNLLIKLIKNFGIIFIFPVLVSLFNLLFHIIQSACEHGSEVTTHLFDLLLQFSNIAILFSFFVLVLFIQFLLIFLELLNLIFIIVNFGTQVIEGGLKFFLGSFVLTGHVRDDILSQFLFTFNCFFEIGLSVTLFIFFSLCTISFLLSNN